MVIRHRTKCKLFEGYILTRSFVGFVFVFYSKTNKIYVYCGLNLCFVETGCHHVALAHLILCRPGWPDTSYANQAGLKLRVILLPLLPKSWDYRCAKGPLLNCHTNFSKEGGV